MKCNKCGGEITEETRVCPHCGNPIIRIKPKSICGNCGTEVSDQAEYCPGCGKKIIRRPKPELKDMKLEAVRDPRADAYAWEQAVLPTVISLLYYFVKRGNGDFTEILLNSLMIFGGFTVMFGLMDTSDLNRRLRQRRMILSEELQMQIAFFPILGLWKRRGIPGMDKSARYPEVHSVLLLIYVFVISFGGSLNQLLYF